MKRIKTPLLCCVLIAVLQSVSFAAEPVFLENAVRSPNQYAFKDSFDTYFFGTREVYELKLVPDILIGTTGILMNIAALNIVANRTITAGTNSVDLNDVNPFDRWSAAKYNEGIDITSTVFEVVTALSPALLFFAPMEDWATIGVMYAESFLLAFGAKEMGKALIPRSRPYNYFPDAPQAALDNGEFGESFFSGHTTIAFNGAVFVSTVFSAYFPDSIWKIPVIAGSLSFAATTGILRIASGSHFFSDVLFGAIVGGATGFLVPYLHSITGFPFNRAERQEDTLSLSVVPGVVAATVWFEEPV
jgi:undecaprenyl-diphosphatase